MTFAAPRVRSKPSLLARSSVLGRVAGPWLSARSRFCCSSDGPSQISGGNAGYDAPAAWGRTTVAAVVSGYLPHLLDVAMDQGRLYGVPDQMNAWSLYLNNRLFRVAGLDPARDAPRTWTDIARLNKILTRRNGGQIVQKGFEMRYPGDGHWQAQMFQLLVYQAGGDILSRGTSVFNNGAGVRALDVWKSVTVAPQVTQNTQASPYQDFADEQDAMTFAGPNAGASIERINPKMAGNYTVVPLPQIDPAHPVTLIYSYMWTVNARASSVQGLVAWDFIHFVSTRPAEWWAAARYLQPVKDWYDAPGAKQTPFLGVFVHDPSLGRAVARTTDYLELQAAFQRVIDRVVLNNGDPKQSLGQAAAEYTKATTH
jgi:multiple sugar transport system substrate-binding protein